MKYPNLCSRNSSKHAGWDIPPLNSSKSLYICYSRSAVEVCSSVLQPSHLCLGLRSEEWSEPQLFDKTMYLLLRELANKYYRAFLDSDFFHALTKAEEEKEG